MAPPPLGISRIALGHSVLLGSDDPSKLAALDDAAAWLVYPSRSYVPQKVQVLIDFLREQFRHGPPGDRLHDAMYAARPFRELL